MSSLSRLFQWWMGLLSWAPNFLSLSMIMDVHMARSRLPFEMTWVERFCSMHWRFVVGIAPVFCWVVRISLSRASNSTRHTLALSSSIIPSWMATPNGRNYIFSRRTASPLNTKRYGVAWSRFYKPTRPQEACRAKLFCSCPPSSQGSYRGFYWTSRLIHLRVNVLWGVISFYQILGVLFVQHRSSEGLTISGLDGL